MEIGMADGRTAIDRHDPGSTPAVAEKGADMILRAAG
jgi:hypothetical protein